MGLNAPDKRAAVKSPIWTETPTHSTKMIAIKTATRSAWPLWSSLALLALAGAARAQFYAATDLGALGGTNGMAYGLNNHEQIVGTAQTGPATTTPSCLTPAG